MPPRALTLTNRQIDFVVLEGIDYAHSLLLFLQAVCEFSDYKPE